jgi:hypothetical protein
MSLPAVSLDDLDWAALTAAARARIPAASGGRWTLHAPVDPGVTLLELYAALLEQRLYWMDQTPDAMLRGGLALLGEAPKDAAVAATVLYFPTGDRTVAAATAMQLQDSECRIANPRSCSPPRGRRAFCRSSLRGCVHGSICG